MINALVLRVVALRATWEKDLMELINFTRAWKSGILSEYSAKLRFAYRFSSSINPSDMSGISADILFFKFLMSCRVI